MALLDVNFFSEALGLSTGMRVILPQSTSAGQIGLGGVSREGKLPVLFLLHGWSDDETIWSRRTSVERYAADMGLVIVMPRGDLSFYQDMVTGMKYWTLLSEEIPSLCRAWFPVTSERAGTFAAGLSMGGYGALRLGLAKPECFRAVASLSGAVDIRARWRARLEAAPVSATKLEAIFGPDGPGPESDLFGLAERAAGSSPSIYQTCGTEDYLYAENLRFRDHARDLGLDLTYDEAAGSHEWGYWDAAIQRVLKWLGPMILDFHPAPEA